MPLHKHSAKEIYLLLRDSFFKVSLLFLAIFAASFALFFLYVYPKTLAINKENQTSTQSLGTLARQKNLMASLEEQVTKFIPLPIETHEKKIAVDLPILLYHYIRIAPKTDRLGQNLSVTPENFRKQMGYLKKYGYTTITPDELFKSLKSGKKLPAKSVILTFDDGYKDFYTEVFPILKTYDFKATVFMITNYIGRDGYLSWDELTELKKSGLVTIGSHTMNHPSLTSISEDRATKEISISKEILERRLGQINYLAYPNGKYNKKVLEIVKKSGYLGAFSTESGTLQDEKNPYVLKRKKVGGEGSMASFINLLTK